MNRWTLFVTGIYKNIGTFTTGILLFSIHYNNSHNIVLLAASTWYILFCSTYLLSFYLYLMYLYKYIRVEHELLQMFNGHLYNALFIIYCLDLHEALCVISSKTERTLTWKSVNNLENCKLWTNTEMKIIKLKKDDPLYMSVSFFYTAFFCSKLDNE